MTKRWMVGLIGGTAVALFGVIFRLRVYALTSGIQDQWTVGDYAHSYTAVMRSALQDISNLIIAFGFGLILVSYWACLREEREKQQ